MDYEYLLTYYVLLVQRMNFNICGLKILWFFFTFAFCNVIYINLHTFTFLHVILRNNKAICSINHLFNAFFSFLIFDYEYLFTYYVLLVQRKNFNIFGLKILWFFFTFAFCNVIYINLHTFTFLHVLLRNKKAICNNNYLFIAFFSFLIFGLRIPLTILCSPGTEEEFQHFWLENLWFFYTFAFCKVI